VRLDGDSSGHAAEPLWGIPMMTKSVRNILLKNHCLQSSGYRIESFTIGFHAPKSWPTEKINKIGGKKKNKGDFYAAQASQGRARAPKVLFPLPKEVSRAVTVCPTVRVVGPGDLGLGALSGTMVSPQQRGRNGRIRTGHGAVWMWSGGKLRGREEGKIAPSGDPERWSGRISQREKIKK